MKKLLILMTFLTGSAVAQNGIQSCENIEVHGESPSQCVESVITILEKESKIDYNFETIALLCQNSKISIVCTDKNEYSNRTNGIPPLGAYVKPKCGDEIIELGTNVNPFRNMTACEILLNEQFKLNYQFEQLNDASNVMGRSSINNREHGQYKNF